MLINELDLVIPCWRVERRRSNGFLRENWPSAFLLSMSEARLRRYTCLASASSHWDSANIPKPTRQWIVRREWDLLSALHRCIGSKVEVSRRNHKQHVDVSPNLFDQHRSFPLPFPSLSSFLWPDFSLSLRVESSGLSSRSDFKEFYRGDSFRPKQWAYLEERDWEESLVHRLSSTSLLLRTCCNNVYSRLRSRETSSVYRRATIDKSGTEIRSMSAEEVMSSNVGERFNRVSNDQMVKAYCWRTLRNHCCT